VCLQAAATVFFNSTDFLCTSYSPFFFGGLFRCLSSLITVVHRPVDYSFFLTAWDEVERSSLRHQSDTCLSAHSAIGQQLINYVPCNFVFTVSLIVLLDSTQQTTACQNLSKNHNCLLHLLCCFRTRHAYLLRAHCLLPGHDYPRGRLRSGPGDDWQLF
jgi:hypothetical protein